MTDREAIFDFIVADSPRAAVAIDDRLRNTVERLKDFPESGRIGRVDLTRELVVSGTPFVIVYRIELDRVRILRVLHGAQRWPA